MQQGRGLHALAGGEGGRSAGVAVRVARRDGGRSIQLMPAASRSLAALRRASESVSSACRGGVRRSPEASSSPCPSDTAGGGVRTTHPSSSSSSSCTGSDFSPLILLELFRFPSFSCLWERLSFLDFFSFFSFFLCNFLPTAASGEDMAVCVIFLFFLLLVLGV